jgi:hypothetical protein
MTGMLPSSWRSPAAGVRWFSRSTGWALSSMPKFYLVGPFMHPGAGLTGAGSTTAMRILQDLKIDFGQVIEAETHAAGERST